jgi:hypothetical protein
VTTTTDAFLGRFRDWCQIGPQAWSAQCNRHKAPNDFLSVERVDREFRLACRAGCLLDEILRAHGLTAPDLLIDADGEAAEGAPPAGAGVARQQRFTHTRPCPICGGAESDPRGVGRRCNGYRSRDGRYAYCSREEASGGLPLYGDTGAYAHALEGSCRCGVPHGEARPPRSSNGQQPRPTEAERVVQTRRWTIFERGVPIAVHVRRDVEGADGERYKRLHWEQPDGTPGLGGRSPASLPLYGLPALDSAPDGALVVVTEGEPATDALREHGILAAGTVGGAGVPPTDDGVRLLLRFRVVLWPDHDATGAQHMTRIAEGLHRLGQGDVRRATWTEAPPAGDAVDFFAAGHTAEEARALLEIAAPIELDGSVEPETEATMADCGADEPERFEPKMDVEAFSGLAGRIVEAIEPHSEASPVAILLHMLVGLGSLIGRGPHALVEKTPHHVNEFVALVGRSSKGRKGQAWSVPRWLLAQADGVWASQRVVSGLSSGEGLIYHVRDPRDEQQPIKEKGRVTGYATVCVDEGVADKRLLVFEAELASVLRRMGMDSNSLSAVLRQAWDEGRLATLTKNSPLRATGAHVGLIAHVTLDELAVTLTETERANGFANRFLFHLVERSKMLPEGGEIAEATLWPLVEEIRRVVAHARRVGRIQRDAEARALWAAVYPELSGGKPGLLGAVTARAEAHVLRLSVLYALLDEAAAVGRQHLLAALAVWDHAAASAERIFGDRTGLSVADTLLRALRQRGPMTRDALRNLFHRNKSAADLDSALSVLVQQEKVRRTARPAAGGRGRPAAVWEAV